MNLTAHDIDSIVAEVVRRLKDLSAAQPSSPPTAINEKVITLETLKKYNGSTQLVIGPNAILTPAARDELNKRNQRLVRQGTTNNHVTNNRVAPGKLLAASMGADYQTQTLAQLVAVYGASLEQHAVAALPQLIETHSQRVTRESAQAIWFTSQPAHAVCLANRHANVWAVQGTDEASVRAALKSIPANVLVIDPKGKSQFTLRKMVDAFVK